MWDWPKLIHDPQVLILDEPTSGLDPIQLIDIRNLVKEVGKKRTVILSTHIVEDVSDLCEQMAIISRGQVLLSGKPQQTMREIEGKIWRRVVDAEGLARCHQRHHVISTHLASGRTVVHVYADAPPEEGFEPVEASLKDVYFSTLRAPERPVAA